MKISIFTFTRGRWHYLYKLLNSISSQPLDKGLIVDHKIIAQGCKFEAPYASSDETTFIEWENNVGCSEGMNRILPTLDGELIIKMDEDCIIQSNEFFIHVAAIHELKPNLVFSPYPVGLINNPGGVLSNNREVIYSKETDTYYTLRYVNHIGGFARISPGFTKNWRFIPDDLTSSHSGNEDVQFSTLCRLNGIAMAYLENAIIVEHQESTLGQKERYKNYFK